MPIRHQRKRTKGSKLPAGTICVTRGTRWGNPYRITAHIDRSTAVYLFRKHLERMREEYSEIFEEYIAPLRERDLACWCPVGEKDCHASVLLDACFWD